MTKVLITLASIAAALFICNAAVAPSPKLRTSSRAFVVDPTAYYKLETMFQGPTKCLEGNRFAPTSTLGGAAFIAPCTTPSTAQMWKFVPAANGYYRMKTKLRVAGKCFEGNRFASTSTLGGAAFMDNCQNVSEQLWKMNHHSGEYFTLTTMFREPRGECLEGNMFASTSTLNGAAFMSGCRPFSGQFFKAVKL